MVVCSACGNEGHSSSSIKCPIKLKKEEELSRLFFEYINSEKLYDTPRVDFEKLGLRFGISKHKAQKLHKMMFANEPESFFESSDDKLIEEIFSEEKECGECGSMFPNVGNEMFRSWCSKEICSNCWFEHSKDREELWGEIMCYLDKKHGKSRCWICEEDIIYGNYPYNRFQCDHLNSFEKNDSICNMVKRGLKLEDIIEEIEKCQLVCYSCHTVITHLEKKLPFSRIKQDLTKRYNQGKLSIEEYNNEKLKYGKIYEERMVDLYKKLGDRMKKNSKK